MKFKIFAGVVLAASTAAAGANALSESFTSTAVTATPTFNTTLSLPMFDPSLGTLTEVQLDLIDVVAGSQTLENLEAAPQQNEFYGGATITMTVAGETLSHQALWLSSMVTLAPFDGQQDFSGPDTLTGSGSNTFDISRDFNVNAITGAPFTGAGTLYPYVEADSLTATEDGAHYFLNVDAIDHNRASVEASVTYTYDAPVVIPPVAGVPEPTAWALMLVGFGGMGVALRRRRLVAS